MLDERIPELNIERDERSGLIMLEQDSGGNIDRLALHPIHVRFLAEQMGLVATSDPEGAKKIAALERRLRILQGWISNLADSLLGHQNPRAADITGDLAFAVATADLADEFVAELDGAVTVESRSERDKSVTDPESGAEREAMLQASGKQCSSKCLSAKRPHPVRTEGGQESESGK